MSNNHKYSFSGLEIAIIGMSGRFPGAKNTREFWNNLINGVESIPFFSDEELKKTGVKQELLTNLHYVKTRGGIVEDSEYFDAEFFGYTPLEAEIIAPQTRIFHECCWEALEDAGYDPWSFPGAIGLYAGGRNSFDWQALAMVSGKSAQLGDVLSSTLYDKDNMTFRVSYHFNLRGPCFSLNTACSTALVAVHLACQGLLSGECHMALAGAAAINVYKQGGYLYQEGDIMSPDGHLRAFDVEAKGLVYSDGVGVVVLKPLEDAIAARDHIYVVIKGSAINNDGHNKVSYTAPAVKGQANVIRAALHMAEVEPESITYVETHGTGTSIGDPIEIQALKQVFHCDRKHFCAIGSVKTNVGHMTEAAGAGGLIKTVLALKHRLIPPSLHFVTPNPEIDFQNSPFYVNRQLKKWGNSRYPLRAGVSSFARGGTNAHVVLEEWSDDPSSHAQRTAHSARRKHRLILLSAGTQPALDKMTENLAEYFKKNLLNRGNHENPTQPGPTLSDAAYTLKVGRKVFEHRRRLVCSNVSEAVEMLSSQASRKVRTFSTREDDRPVVFMFSGLGSQYVNMGLGLYETEPVFRQEIDHCFEILNGLLDYDIKKILYPGKVREDISPGPNKSHKSYMSYKNINQIEVAQVVVFIFEYALAKSLMKWGIKPEAMVGYSFGEYTAACIAGVFSLEDTLEIIVNRGQFLRKLPRGVMLSVPLPKNQLEPLLNHRLAIAIDNGPSCVVSGSPQAVKALEQQLKEQRLMCMPLNSSHALHSPMMEPILPEFENHLCQLQLKEPHIPYISNVTGSWITKNEAMDPAYWTKHLRETVRFAEGINELVKEERTVFIEIGPGRQLSALVARSIYESCQQQVLNLVKPEGSEISDLYYLLNKIGDLWLYGVKINWSAFYSHQERNRISLPTYPFQRKRFTITIPIDLQNQFKLYPGVVGESASAPQPMAVNMNEGDRPNLVNPYVAPTGEKEQTLALIWQELLGFKDIGSEDDFLELGGDSLKAITVLSRVHKEYKIVVPLREFFKTPTIKTLSAYIHQAEKRSFLSIPPAETMEYYPLSYIQERIYILQQLDLQSVSYNLPQVYIIDGKIDRIKLVDVFKKLICRYEVLKTSFPVVNDKPVQKIHENVVFEIEYYDLTTEATGGKGVSLSPSLVKEKIIKDFIRPFDLSAAPLLRVGLIKPGEKKHILMVDTHHILSDGVSNAIFIQDFFWCYAGKELPGIILQYKDYSQWQNSPGVQQALRQQETFWLKELAGQLPILHLPTDFSRPPVRSFAGNRKTVEIPGEETGKFKEMAKEEDTTLYMVLLSIFNVLLAKLSGQEDIIIGVDTAGRTHADLQQMIGVFINTLVLRTYPAKNKTFKSFLNEIMVKTLEIFENQDYPFDHLVEQVVKKRDTSRNPIFDVMFSYESFQIKPLEIPENTAHLKIKPWRDESRMSKLDINVKIRTGQTIVIIFEYSTKLFKEKTIQRFSNYFREIAAAVIKNRDTRLGDIKLSHDLLAVTPTITARDLEF
jgi:phthiocerol/phenolphthiocerol synthesis type-I polyketide synthase E